MDSTILSLPVKVFSESTAYAVQSDRVDAAIDESKAKTQDTKVVPKDIIICLRSWIEIKPQHENVLWEEAHSKNNDESHYHLRQLFTSLYLFNLKQYVIQYVLISQMNKYCLLQTCQIS